MKLFVSYAHETETSAGFSNAFIDDQAPPTNGEEARAIQDRIVQAGGYTKVSLVTWKVIP